jgi:TolB-like protein
MPAPTDKVLFIMRVYPLLKQLFPLVAIMQMAMLCSAAGVTARDYTVALVPFRMNADENIAYIENGVQDMIASRISYNAPITLVEQSLVHDELASMSAPELTREKLMELGSALQADYVIGGSISKVGSNVSIDVTILNVMNGGTTSTVFAQSLGLDELIPHMMVLTREIADTISREGEPASNEITGVQPPAEAETGFEEQVQGTENVDEKTPARGASEHDGAVETNKPLSGEADSEMDTKPESVETNESSSGDLRERLLQRESEIDSLDENPAYQKSIDDLESASESTDEKSTKE